MRGPIREPLPGHFKLSSRPVRCARTGLETHRSRLAQTGRALTLLALATLGTFAGHSEAFAQPLDVPLVEAAGTPNFLLTAPRFGESSFPLPSSEFAQESDVDLRFRANALEDALRTTYTELDDLILLSVLRSAITGVNQAYCAIDNLVPQGEQQLTTIDYMVGIGCAAATVALFAISAVTAGGLRADDDDRDRLERFRDARRRGLTEEDMREFEVELEDAASGATIERVLGMVMGTASLGTAIVAVVLAAAGVIDAMDGTTLAVGSSLVATVSFPVLAIDSPAETALQRYRSQTNR